MPPLNRRGTIGVICGAVAALLLLVLVIFTCLNSDFWASPDDDVIPVVRGPVFLNRHGAVIDVDVVERDEQDMARKYIGPRDVVLELGARYGTVSCAIARRLRDPERQLVAVEPDPRVIPALERNMKANSCRFNVVNAIVSEVPHGFAYDSYSSRMVESSSGISGIPSISFYSLQNKYGLQFDTLIADCEGCVCPFFKEYPELLDQFRKIIIEHDIPQACDYGWLQRLFIAHGFRRIVAKFNEVLRTIWIR
jgi:FkbM family methyltransferase